MQSNHFSTYDLAKSRQLDAWREWYAYSYEVSPLDAGESGFAAESEVWKLNGVGFARISAPPLRAARTKLLTRRDPTDHVCLTIGRRAVTGMTFGSDCKEVPAGSPFVFALDGAHVSERDADERLQLYIARDRFPEAMPALDAARGGTVSTSLGALLAEYFNILRLTLPTLRDEEAQRLPSAIVAMVVACVAPSADRMAMASGPLDATRKDKVRRFILRNLYSPNLGPDLMSKELGISRSNLYRLLESEGGVVNYIKLHRLWESFTQLSDPRNTKPVAEIAEALRLADSSGFSRAFRKQFGASPTEVREAVRTGSTSALAHPRSELAQGESFRGFLRTL